MASIHRRFISLWLFSGALMIEPTETETPETLDAFVEAMLAIAQETKENPDVVKNAPHSRRSSVSMKPEQLENRF